MSQPSISGRVFGRPYRAGPSGMGIPQGECPNAIKLARGSYSEDDFADSFEEVNDSGARDFLPWSDAGGTFADGVGEKKSSEFIEDFVDRFLADEQVDDPALECMEGDGTVDLLAVFSTPLRLIRLRKLGAGFAGDDTFQISQEHSGMDVLENGFHGRSTEVLYIQSTFELPIEGLHPPAQMIQLRKL